MCEAVLCSTLKLGSVVRRLAIFVETKCIRVVVLAAAVGITNYTREKRLEGRLLNVRKFHLSGSNEPLTIVPEWYCLPWLFSDSE